MAAEAPLKKNIGEGGFEAHDQQREKTGREKLAAEWSVLKGGAEQETESHVQRAKSWKDRIFSLFQKAVLPKNLNAEFEKNTSAAEESLEKLKQEAAELLEEKTQEKLDLKAESAALFERLKGKPAQKMVEELYAYKEKISQFDEYGQIGDVQFDENRGQIRVEYADGSSLRKFPHGLVLRVHEGGEIETIESPFKPKKPAAVPKSAEAVAPAANPDTPKRNPKEALKALEDAKTSAQLRAAIMDNKHLKAEELARLSDADLEKMRLSMMDELDGGNREVTAEIEAEAAGEILTFAQKLEAQRPISAADKAKLLAGAEKVDAEEGPNADVHLMNEAELGKEFDRLSSLVAIEGGKGSKAWAEALKSGIEPEISDAGKRLNLVQRRLTEFRTEQPVLLEPSDVKKKPAPKTPGMAERVAQLLAEEEAAAENGASGVEVNMDASGPEAEPAPAPKKKRGRTKSSEGKGRAKVSGVVGEVRPEDVYPNLPERTPGSFPPGVPDGTRPNREPGKPSEVPVAEPPKETGTEAKTEAPEGKLNPLNKETMELVMKKTDELGLGETYKTVTSEKFVKSLEDSGIKIEFGSLVSPQSFLKSWKAEMEKRKKAKDKKK